MEGLIARIMVDRGVESRSREVESMCTACDHGELKARVGLTAAFGLEDLREARQCSYTLFEARHLMPVVRLEHHYVNAGIRVHRCQVTRE